VAIIRPQGYRDISTTAPKSALTFPQVTAMLTVDSGDPRGTFRDLIGKLARLR